MSYTSALTTGLQASCDAAAVQVTSLEHAEALRKAHDDKIAALAVAAERARAVEVVREIVERLEAECCVTMTCDDEAAAWVALETARECLAAVEGKR